MISSARISFEKNVSVAIFGQLNPEENVDTCRKKLSKQNNSIKWASCQWWNSVGATCENSHGSRISHGSIIYMLRLFCINRRIFGTYLFIEWIRGYSDAWSSWYILNFSRCSSFIIFIKWNPTSYILFVDRNSFYLHSFFLL